MRFWGTREKALFKFKEGKTFLYASPLPLLPPMTQFLEDTVSVLKQSEQRCVEHLSRTVLPGPGTKIGSLQDVEGWRMWPQWTGPCLATVDLSTEGDMS